MSPLFMKFPVLIPETIPKEDSFVQKKGVSTC